MEDIICHVEYFDDLLKMRDYINYRKIGKEDLIAIFPIERKFVLVYYG